MKKTLTSALILFLIFSYQVKAQNPYDAIGKKTTMLTLTKGKYPEYHVYDSIQRIGSVIMNIKRGTIVKLLERDSLSVDPEIATRWWSVDPMAHERSSWTPYNYCTNNPILRIDPTGALDKEYETEADYKKENPNGKLDGSDGHWLKSDRENKTTTWGNANTTNLQANRYGDYETITQRKDFYGWYAGKIDEKGFENNWPGAAYIVAGQMSNLDNPAVAWWVGNDVVKFGNAGNKAIFNDVFDNLKDLYNGPAMKGQAAANWDASTLHNEQFNVVQPIYMKQTAATISTLSQMSKGQGLYGLGVTGALRFEGNVLNPQDRFNHGAGKVTNFFNLQKTYWKAGW